MQSFDFEPCHYTFLLFIHLYNCLNIIHIKSKSFRLLNIALMTAKSTYPIELMHSLSSRICVFKFANVSFKGHFVYMLKLLTKHNVRKHVKKYTKNDEEEMKAVIGFEPA